VLQLAQRLGLDLTDTLTRHRELLTNFFQRVVGVHADTKAHPKDTFLTRRERGQNPRRRFTQVRLDRRIDGQNCVLVLDEIAQMTVFLVTNGVSSEIGSLAIFRTLRTFSSGMAEAFPKALPASAHDRSRAASGAMSARSC
jgi:hypothetical protein